MKSQRINSILGFIALAMAGFLFQEPARVFAQGGYPISNDGTEVLTRGPIHEAFAQPGDYNPSLGAVVLRQSPVSIEEIPPDQRPEGDALWIPGYWQWDDDRDDFIWISGIWRLPPPEQSWVPGYWTPANQGWSWTSGFWLADRIEEVQYLRQPPESLELGPSSPPPSHNHLWAPGCWSWSETRYAWRPGYWVEARPDWIWEPAHYVRTPRGCIYVDGYWDRPLERRGVIFAPVYFDRPIYRETNYRYSPSIVIEVSILITHLFVDQRRHHYSFGDYYGEEYSRRGYQPWFDYHERHRGYDPIYVHERWKRGRDNSHWDDRIREDYRFRVEHTDARPPRVYRDQSSFEARAPESTRRNFRMAAPLVEVSSRKDNPVRFEKIDDDRRKSYQGKGREVVSYRDERVKWESQGERFRGNDDDNDRDNARDNDRNDDRDNDRNDDDNDKRSDSPMKGPSSPRETSREQSNDTKRDDSNDKERNENPQPRQAQDNRNPSTEPIKDVRKVRDVNETLPPRQAPDMPNPATKPSGNSGTARDINKNPESSQTPDARIPSTERSKDVGRVKDVNDNPPSKRDSDSREPSKSQSREAGEGRPSPSADGSKELSRDNDNSERSERVKIPKSPVRGNLDRASRPDGNPPPRPDMPQADSKVRSKNDEDRSKSKPESDALGEKHSSPSSQGKERGNNK